MRDRWTIMLLRVNFAVVRVSGLWVFFFFKQKTAYEMRISDWSSDVCSSDLRQIAAEDKHVNAVELGAVYEFLEANVRAVEVREIGRASCRERVCQYV